MFIKKRFIYFLLWIITILIAIIFTFENPDKIQALKNKLKKDDNSIKTLDQDSVIDTAYYSLNLKKIKTPVSSKYGGIEAIGEKIYYISGDSEFFQLQKKKNNQNKYDFIPLSLKKINNNKDKFLQKNASVLTEKYAQAYFGVKDILIEEFKSFENKVLLASSLYYDVDKDCYNMSVYLSEIIDENILQISDWKKIFSSNKCLSITLTKKPNFAAASAGGRIVKLDDENILLSVGDFYADGVNGPMLSQNLNNDYGKIIKININNKKYEIFSYGHRNPQGLYIDKKKNIFSTEHGPRGGDELNLVRKDNNYGWPYATFGTNYNSYNAYKDNQATSKNKSKRVWPIDKTNNTHNGFTKPIFSWGNTFGASNLIVYENEYFKKWNTNIIVSSLAAKQLTRFIYNYDNSSIHYLENIPIGKRVRDIILLDNGSIALLTDVTSSGESTEDNHAEIIIINNSEKLK